MGWLEKYQDGGDVNELSAKQFTLDYIKSPKYKERLEFMSSHKNPDKVIQDRYNIVNSIDQVLPSDKGSQYNTVFHQMYYDPNQASQKLGINKNQVLAHEFAHVETNPFEKDVSLGGNEYFEMYNRLKDIPNAKYKHQVPNVDKIEERQRPTETKADLNGLRYDLKSKGIYDAGTEDFKLKHLRKLDNSFFENRLRKNFKKKDVKWMMNNIAQNNQLPAQENNVKNGGIIPKAKDGWLGKYTPPTVVQDIVDNLDYSKFTPEAIELKKHGYPEGFPRRVEDIRMSPIDNRPQLTQGIYETPEAIAADENTYRMREVGKQLQDFGSRNLHGLYSFGLSTIGDAIQASPTLQKSIGDGPAGLLAPTPESYLEANRDSWNNRSSNAMNAVSMLLAGEVVPPIAINAIRALPTVAKAPLQAYRGVIDAATKGEIYKYNPFASGIKENMAYRPITASRAQKLLQGEPMLQYSPIENTKSYMPVLDEAGNVTHYNIATNKDLFQKYSLNQPVTVKINKSTLYMNPVTGKLSNPSVNTQSTLSEVLKKINSGKYAGKSIIVGDNKIIGLPSKKELALSPGKDYTEQITKQFMSVRGNYPRVGTDVKFTWGKVPKNMKFTIPGKKGVSSSNTINRQLILEADPTKISMVGAPTKGEFAKYIPRDAGNFSIGKTVIPEKGIIGNELSFPNKGLRVLKLDPVRGYIPISETESATLFETGTFKPDESALINNILQFDKGVGIAKDFVKGSFNWMDHKIADQQKLAHQYNDMQYPIEREINEITWKIQQNVNKATGYLEQSPSTFSTFRANSYIDKAKPFRIEGNTIVANETGGLRNATNTGKQVITDFKTGKQVESSVQVPSASTKYKVIKDSGKSQLKSDVEVIIDMDVNNEYKQTLQNNIKHIEETIPGAKVFGSSKGVSEGGLPHLTHDYDVLISQRNYDKNVKGKLDFVADIGVAKQHTIDKKLGQEGVIDFNIIEETSSGYATGERANQIFKQFHPDAYFKASRKAFETGKPIEIPYTPDELLSNTDATVKTIVDAYESVKPKHINKIDAYISYGKPEVVIQAQEKYLKSLVGSKGTLGYQFSPEHFANTEVNKKLLNEIDFIGDINSVAKNPERMQIALNDFYINNTVLSRGVNANDLKTAEQALKIWCPECPGAGGQAMGSGMNHVLAGESGHGNIYGNKQLGLNWNISSPSAYIDDIKRQTDGNYLFSPEERIEVEKILQKYGVNNYKKNITNPGELIINTSYNRDAKAILSEVAEKTGRRSTAYGGYGNSTYSSTLTDFDEIIDALEFSARGDVTVPKSMKLRKDNLQRNGGQSIRDVRTYHQIKNLLNDGIKKAEQREALIKKMQEDYQKIIQEKIDKAVDKSSLIKEKTTIISDLENKRYDAQKKVNDLYSRLNRLQSIRTIIKLTTPIAGVIGGITKGVHESNKADKELYFKNDTGKPYHNATEQEKQLYEEYYEYKDEQFDKQYDEWKKQRKNSNKKVHRKRPQLLNWNDWQRGQGILQTEDNSNLLRIKKNGGTIKNSHQLTNFTKTTADGWLDKYE